MKSKKQFPSLLLELLEVGWLLAQTSPTEVKAEKPEPAELPSPRSCGCFAAPVGSLIQQHSFCFLTSWWFEDPQPQRGRHCWGTPRALPAYTPGMRLALENLLFLSRPSPRPDMPPEIPAPCRQSEHSSADARLCSQRPIWKGADEIVQIKMHDEGLSGDSV